MNGRDDDRERQRRGRVASTWRIMPELENLASCPRCRELVMLFPLSSGSVLLWDPDFVQRRFIRSILGNTAASGVVCSSRFGSAHVCPVPISDVRPRVIDCGCGEFGLTARGGDAC